MRHSFLFRALAGVLALWTGLIGFPLEHRALAGPIAVAVPTAASVGSSITASALATSIAGNQEADTFPPSSTSSINAGQAAAAATCQKNAAANSAVSLISAGISNYPGGVGTNNGTALGSASGQMACNASGSVTSVTQACPILSPTAGSQMSMMGMGMGGGLNSADEKVCEDPSQAAPVNQNLAAQLAEITNQFCSDQCQAAKIALMKNSLNCLISSLQSLTSGMAGLSSAFQAEISVQQGNMRTLKSQLADTTAQMADVDSRLQGSDGGAPGLLSLQAQLQAEVSSLPSTIQAAQSQNTTIATQTAVLNQQTQNELMSDVSTCMFTTPVANYQCVANGPAVTFSQYVQCTASKTARQGTIQSNGQYSQGGLAQAQVTGTTNQVGTLMSTIQQNIASGQTVSATDGSDSSSSSSETSSGAGSQINTLSDLVNDYGSQLSALGIEQMVVAAYNACYSRAQAQVNNDTNILQRKNAIVQSQQQAQAAITSAMTTAQQNYAAVTAGIGQTGSFNSSACVNQPLTTQVNCLQNTQSLLNNMLDGTGNTNLKGSIALRSTQGDGVVIPYTGLNGLVQGLNSAKQSLTTVQTTQNTAIQQLPQKAMTDAQNYVKQMATALSPASASISTLFNSLTQGMSGLNITGFSASTATLATVQGEQLQADGDGMPTAPQSMTNLIGGAMTPPLADINGAGVTGLTSSLNQASAALQQSMQQLSASKMMVMQQQEQEAQELKTCQNKLVSTLKNEVIKSVKAYDGINCYGRGDCSPNNRSGLQKLLQDSSKITSQVVPSWQLASLNSGLANICKYKPNLPEAKKTKITPPQRLASKRSNNNNSVAQMQMAQYYSQQQQQNQGMQGQGGQGQGMQQPYNPYQNQFQPYALNNGYGNGGNNNSSDDDDDDDAKGEESEEKNFSCNIVSELKTPVKDLANYSQAAGRRKSNSARK